MPFEMEALISQSMTLARNQQLPIHADGDEGLEISSLDYRLCRLQRLSLKAEQCGDLRPAAQILDQAAKEQRAGGGEGVEDGRQPKITPEQAREELRDFLMRYEAMRDRGERRDSQAGLPRPFGARNDGVGGG